MAIRRSRPPSNTIAFCRQTAVPSIPAVVHRGGRSPIIQQTRKRNDDTMVSSESSSPIAIRHPAAAPSSSS